MKPELGDLNAFVVVALAGGFREGARLLERLGPAFTEIEAALDVVNGFRDRPTGTLQAFVDFIAKYP